MFSSVTIIEMAPNANHTAAIAAGLDATARQFAIASPQRAAMFLAQVTYESWYFSTMEENLNYSMGALLANFPGYFTPESAAALAHSPQQIANRIYANRLGNGDEASGDGWTFRGRGYIQLTGRYNYEKFAAALHISLDDAIGYLETIEGACASAGWFWDLRSLNTYADRGDFLTVTRLISGSLNSLQGRTDLWNTAKELLGVSYIT